MLGCVHAQSTLPQDLASIDAVALRARGQEGLDALLDRYDATNDAEERTRLVDVITQVAAQKDAHVSRLYWYEDLDAALAEAKRTKRPVLSLRMLGRLDQELSCANSRFFRTTLYANADVSKYLRQHFVLHWSSERPVPVATIDFGDGRKVTRTVTGNSIHYVLDENGAVVDALPGLYGAKPFLESLERTLKPAMASGRFRERWHGQEQERMLEAFNADQKAAGITQVSFSLPTLPGLDIAGVWPSSRDAVPMAMPKAMVELPMVRGLVPDGGAQLEKDPTPWERLASVRAKGSKLDARSRALVLSKNPVDVTSPDVPRLSDALAKQMISRLEDSIAADTARNEYALHAVIHRWLQENPNVALKDLNREVYARLFLTPATDPWLGLVPALTWTGLPNDGISLR
ncbi:MAG: hypothetical protein QM817_33640 [Archangium sp.]